MLGATGIYSPTMAPASSEDIELTEVNTTNTSDTLSIPPTTTIGMDTPFSSKIDRLAYLKDQEQRVSDGLLKSEQSLAKNVVYKQVGSLLVSGVALGTASTVTAMTGTGGALLAVNAFNTLVSLSDACCAGTELYNKQHNKSGLTFAEDSVKNAIYKAASTVSSEEDAKNVAERVTPFIRTVSSIAPVILSSVLPATIPEVLKNVVISTMGARTGTDLLLSSLTSQKELILQQKNALEGIKNNITVAKEYTHENEQLRQENTQLNKENTELRQRHPRPQQQ